MNNDNLLNDFSINGYCLRAAINNKAIDVVRFIIEELKFDTINGNAFNYSYLTDEALYDACNSTHDSTLDRSNTADIIKYLVNETDAVLVIFKNLIYCIPHYDEQKKVKEYTYPKIATIMNSLHFMNHPIINIFEHCDENNIKESLRMIVQKIYDYIISTQRYDLNLVSQNPFNIPKYIKRLKYNTIKELCLHSNCLMYLDDCSSPNHKLSGTNLELFRTPFNVVDIRNTLKIQNEFNDFTFVCEFNNDDSSEIEKVNYYCSKWWICHVIPLFKSMIDFNGIEKTKGITLKVGCSKAIFDTYILACCTGT